MKLLFAPQAAYIHKVLVTAHEAGVLDRMTLEKQSPSDPATQIWATNPLGKVPTLIMDDGEPLFGGLLICEYLDSYNTTAPLFPKDSTQWKVRRQMVTGDGVFDAGANIFRAARRPRELWDMDAMKRERRRILSGLALLQQDAAGWMKEPGVFHIGHVATAGALTYLSHREPLATFLLVPEDEGWRWENHFPGLKAWYQTVANRPSFQLRVGVDDIAQYPKA